MINQGPKIVTNGLILCLDAANRKSYSGSGSTWYDLSGNANNMYMWDQTFSYENGGRIDIPSGDNGYGRVPIDFSTFSSYSFEIFYRFTGSSYDFVSFVTNVSTWGVTTGYIRTVPTQMDMRVLGVRTLLSGLSFSSGDWIYVSITSELSQPYKYYIFHNGNFIIGESSSSVGTAFDTLGICLANTTTLNTYKLSPSVLRLYDKILTPAEVRQNYEAIKQRFSI